MFLEIVFLLFDYRTNLPKQLMQLEGYPMDEECPSFPTHTDVLAYIRKVADQCDIRKYIKVMYIGCFKGSIM